MAKNPEVLFSPPYFPLNCPRRHLDYKANTIVTRSSRFFKKITIIVKLTPMILIHFGHLCALRAHLVSPVSAHYTLQPFYKHVTYLSELSNPYFPKCSTHANVSSARKLPIICIIFPPDGPWSSALLDDSNMACHLV